MGNPDGAGPSGHGEIYADWSGARTAILALLGVGVVLVGAALILPSMIGGGEPSGPTDSPTAPAATESDGSDDVAASGADLADRFALALPAGSFEPFPFAFTDAAEALEQRDLVTSGLGPFDLTASVEEFRILDSARAEADLTNAWTLEDGTTFTTSGVLDLVLIGSDWHIDWDVEALESSLVASDRLIYERVSAERAPILDRNGEGLVEPRPVVEVAVRPRNADDPASVVREIATIVGIDGEEAASEITRRPSDDLFVVSVQRVEQVEPVAARLTALPGVELVASTRSLPPSDGFGRALLGRMGPATADILAEMPDVFAEGDLVGRSGLQARYNARLAGMPGRQVRIQRGFSSSPATDGAVIETDLVFVEPPTEGEALQTTLDVSIQAAAEAALAATGQPSALVAVQASTGHVLAAASGPTGSSEERALSGSYPPGSVFKMVTAYGALINGFNADSVVECPGRLTVDGREFGNAGGFELGPVTLRQAFALSCNTAFIAVAQNLSGSDFPSYGRVFGIGESYDLGVAAYPGLVPNPASATDKAATSFGQGQVTVSPLSMAVMAATAASGSYRPPSLVADPSVVVEGRPLVDAAVGPLQSMMASVVNEGTGGAAWVDGPQVHGKTGTAEFGSESPPRSHAWFVGYRGDVAFAVLVEDGGSGSAVAAPIAGDFLRRLPVS